MTFERRPWWLHVVAASFLLLNLFNGYLVIWGPALADGLDGTFGDGGLHVRSVASETPFAKAGLRSGDQVLAVNALPIQGPREWAAALANVKEGQPETWHVQRNGSRLELAVTFEAARWTDRLTAGLLASDTRARDNSSMSSRGPAPSLATRSRLSTARERSSCWFR